MSKLPRRFKAHPTEASRSALVPLTRGLCDGLEMGQLFRLDRGQYADIPIPYNSQASDTYAVLEIDGLTYPILSSGGTAVIREGELSSSDLHVIKASIGAIIVRLTLLADDLVRVDSFCDDFPSHTTPLDKLNIIGAICEVYPKGFSGSRWILWEPSMGTRSQTLLAKPALKATS